MFLHFESTSPERRTSAPRRRSCACARPTRRRTPSRGSTRYPRTWTRSTTPAVRDPGGALVPEGEDLKKPDGSLVVTGYRDAVWLRSRPSSEWRGVGANHRPEVGAEGKAPACVLVTSGQGLRDRMRVPWIVPLKCQNYSSQSSSTQLLYLLL